jgi:predicted phosphodiesterase
MVAIALISDAHQEHYSNQRHFEKRGYYYPGDTAYDVLVLAGDMSGLGILKLWRQIIPNDKPIIFIFGNHCLYGKSTSQVFEYAKELEKELPNTYILNPGTVTLEGINFIGATLWSDGLLKGYPDTREQIEYGINDFRLITAGVVDKFTVQFMTQLYNRDKAYLKKQLDTLKGTNVVVTHFLPSQETIEPKYLGNALCPYFVNDCDDLVAKADLWLTGHSHQRFDMKHSSGTRMVQNAFGYHRELPDDFSWKIIEV